MNQYSSSKVALTGIAVFALAMGFAQAGHAWSFSPSYSPSKQISVSAGRDYMKKAFNTKTVTKNKQVTKDSYNRTNSHDIGGDVKNSNLGSINTGNTLAVGGTNNYATAGKKGQSSMGSIGSFNEGFLVTGNGGNTQQSGSVVLGDNYNVFPGAAPAEE